MKLRLPLSLLAALAFVCSSPVGVAITLTTYANTFPNGATPADWPTYNLLTVGNSSATFGTGSDSPVASALSWTVNGTLNVGSGALTLTGVDYDAGNQIPNVGKISLWIGGHNSDGGTYDSYVKVTGGSLISENMVLISRNGGQDKGFLHISGTGTFKALGIYSNIEATSRPGEIRLDGGSFIMGGSGMSFAAGTVPYSVFFNQGTIGAYANWTAAAGLTFTLGTEANQSLEVDTMGFDITWRSTVVGTGEGNLVKKGEGMFDVFAGAGGNTFTQNVVLNQGTLRIDKDAALGNAPSGVTGGKTVTVTGDSTFTTRNTETALNFNVESGKTLTLQNFAGVTTVYDGKFLGAGSLDIKGSLVFHGKGGENPSDQVNIAAGASLTADAPITLRRSSQITVSGTMTITVSGEPGTAPVGLYVADPSDTAYSISKIIIADGGVFSMPGAVADLSVVEVLESGQFKIQKGGEASLLGFKTGGNWAVVGMEGGTLNLGAEGIKFLALTNDKMPNVYFADGKMVITETSSYAYTGGTVEGTDSGHFIFGKQGLPGVVDPGTERVLEVTDGKTFTIEEKITGGGGFHKTGTGTLVVMKTSDYLGDTLLDEGALYVGANGALGTQGTLAIASGTTLAAEGASVSVNNAVVNMGGVGEATFAMTLGRAGNANSLTFSGAANLLASANTLTVFAGATFSGAVTSNSALLTKEGTGTLGFTGALSGIQTVNVNAGGLMFGSTAAFSEVTTMNMSSGTSLDLGGLAGASGKLVKVNGNVALRGMSSYIGGVSLQAQSARADVTGSLKAGKISFVLGGDNASSSSSLNTLVSLSGSGATAEITGNQKGDIFLDFDAQYITDNLATGGAFQLFSTGLSYNDNVIVNTQKQVALLDVSQLRTTGKVTWQALELQGYLIDQAQSDALGTYAPANSTIYIGSSGGVVTCDAVYDLGTLDGYLFTPGEGTFVYKGLLTGALHELSVIDYARITGNPADHSTGSVVITNNANDFALGTNVNGTTLTVDLSQGSNLGLAGEAVNGNLKVNALGDGDIVVVAGLAGGGTVLLQSYGDQSLAGVNSYTYDNAFSLSGGSAIKQAGANAQILTNDISSGSGNNTISNEGTKSLTLKGNVTQTGASLTLNSVSSVGSILLSGGSELDAVKLNITGAGLVALSSGYKATVRGMNIAGGVFSIGAGSSLFMGQDNLTGSGTLELNGGALRSTTSWTSDVLVRLSGANNVISTGGTNVYLNKGVSGTGTFSKEGTGMLFLYGNSSVSSAVSMKVNQGQLILMGNAQGAETASDYKLTGDVSLLSGSGASLAGRIDANNHEVTFGGGTHFYLNVSEANGLTGYIYNADTISFGSDTKLNVNVLDDTWQVNTNYTVFSANNGIEGGENLSLVLENQFAFVDVALDTSNSQEIYLMLKRKGETPAGTTNKDAINAAVTPMVGGVLDGTTSLTGNLLRTMQVVSKMTDAEYQTYLGDMASSASSYYTALSAQVQDATQHLNSVRNRVELLNPVLYDDWEDGGIYNVWVGAINHYRDVKSDFQAPGYRMDSWGGELGCAIPLTESFMMGVGFAYTFTDVTVREGWGNNDTNTYNVDLFARYRQDRWTLTGVLTGGFSNVEFHRNQLVKDQWTRSNSSTDGNQFMGTFEAMYDVYLNEEKSWVLQPLVNVTAGRAKLDGLSETGDLRNAGLAIGSQSYNMFSVGVGTKIAYEYSSSLSDIPGRVEMKLMYVNDVGDTDFSVRGNFIGSPSSGFELDGVSNEKSAGVISLGWVAPISAFGQFFADASCELRKNQTGVSSTIGLSFQF